MRRLGEHLPARRSRSCAAWAPTRCCSCFMVYAFTFAIYSPATGMSHELRNASIAIVDEDHSQLSRAACATRCCRPTSSRRSRSPPDEIEPAHGYAAATPSCSTSRRTSRRDLRRRPPAGIQLNVDATAMSQAGIGAGYIAAASSPQEIARFICASDASEPAPVDAADRALAFNPNLPVRLVHRRDADHQQHHHAGRAS